VSLLADMRRSQLPLARALVALFAIGWLGLAAQPCAAMVHASDHESVAMDAHHESQGSAGHQCPHCPPTPTKDDCGTGTALSCGDAGIPGPAAKPLEQTRLDAWVVMEFSAAPAVAPALNQPGWPAAQPALLRPPSASIQQRFCSFLK
jgi:hypothetical protein